MNHVAKILKSTRRAQGIIWVGLVLAVLTACGTVVPTLEAPTPDRFDYVTTVTIDNNADQADIEATYDATAVVFRPEAGFAILGYYEGEGRLSLMSDSDSNQDVIETPEVEANGWTAWSGGWTAWSGGWTAWSGGWTAWSGGQEVPTTFGENLAIWDQINLPEAHDMASNLGGGVKIAVIDTGIDLTHPAFAGKLAPAAEWYDFVDNDPVPQEESDASGSGNNDAYGHGTGVAGVILQVAPNATILPIRALDRDGSGDVTWVAAAIDHAMSQGAHIINLSLGTTEDVASLTAMVDYATSQGVYIISSAGNSGDGDITYPAANAMRHEGEKYALGVGSVSVLDVKSEFSTYGNDLELVAPGEMVYTLVPDGRMGYWSGTSFAAPIVTGSVALALGEGVAGNPVIPHDITFRLPKHADNIDAMNPGYLRKLGKGRLDIESYLEDMLGL